MLGEVMVNYWEIFQVLVGLGLVFVFLIWLYNYLSCGVCRSKARMDGKTVIITGGNSGIGKQTALDLANRGARVIIACRNVEKANEVKEYIVKTTNNSNVIVKRMDLSKLRSVREFAEDVKLTETRLDVLIHNAANLVVSEPTEDGLNPVWASNHYGPFLLTLLLTDLLIKTGQSRVVVVSSLIHWIGGVSLKNPNPVEEKSQWRLYRDTKFANLLFSYELAKRLNNKGVTVNSLHPGAVFTPIWKDMACYWFYLAWILRPFMKNEVQGAQTTIHLAVSEEVEGVTGKYFEDCRVWLSHCKTKDEKLSRQFWDISEELVGLKGSDPKL